MSIFTSTGFGGVEDRNTLSDARLLVNDMSHPTVPPEIDLRELHQALDQELSKLPEKYRLPIVLCDLEARSRKEVAGHMKIAEGTLSSRLAAGRMHAESGWPWPEILACLVESNRSLTS